MTSMYDYSTVMYAFAGHCNFIIISTIKMSLAFDIYVGIYITLYNIMYNYYIHYVEWQVKFV